MSLALASFLEQVSQIFSSIWTSFVNIRELKCLYSKFNNLNYIYFIFCDIQSYLHTVHTLYIWCRRAEARKRAGIEWSLGSLPWYIMLYISCSFNLSSTRIRDSLGPCSQSSLLTNPKCSVLGNLELTQKLGVISPRKLGVYLETRKLGANSETGVLSPRKLVVYSENPEF